MLHLVAQKHQVTGTYHTTSFFFWIKQQLVAKVCQTPKTALLTRVKSKAFSSFSIQDKIMTCCWINTPVLWFSGELIRCCSENVSVLHYPDSLTTCNPPEVPPHQI